ncbi:DUF397 domain-containing protein [Streptomyces sp. BE303]|uniref:DUF397 domain-containing protein n=1 Tax=Streptomyces sp. BE303 TaxID=3002528 RepID=UPI002E79A751|nr:DUF397 domain-containing protein [Streptomyces sp. BE303]MED7955141.1 DUF397 domain-containing protein [Streptomyces sp. BE303]
MAEHSWQKSSFSGDAANCLYLAAVSDGVVKIRESDDPEAVITTTPESLRAFIRGVKAGRFDHLAR